MMLNAPLRDALFGSAPGWVIRAYAPYGPLPDIAAHDDIGRYWVKGVGEVPESALFSTSRAATKWAQDSNGLWLQFLSGVPAITRNNGRLVEEARTNKSTNYNANPPALVPMGTLAAFNAAGVANIVASTGDASSLFGIVDDTAAVAAAGLSNICNGRVYKIDNTAGAVTAFFIISGQTGNTNAHSMSAYTKGVGAIRNSSATVNQPFSSPTSYVRTTKANWTPSASTDKLTYAVGAGAVAYFVLGDLEEGAFVTSPIVVAGASATRAADVPSLIGSAASIALLAKSAFFQTNGVAGFVAGPARLLRFQGGTTSDIRYQTTTTAEVSNGTNTASATLGSGTTSGVVKVAAGFDATSMSSVANNGTVATSANAWGTGNTSVTLGNVPAGDRALNGYMQRFALWTNRLTDTQLKALTA